MNQNKIHILVTGGTIDSIWDGELDTAVVAKESTLPDFFKNLIIYADVKFTQICMKDSRNLDQTDVVNILREIENSDCENIIVTHGTYTMPDTAKYVLANLKRKDQKIIFTGSMIPLQGFLPSDAGFNLGYSMAIVLEKLPGVYLCMNGRTFLPDEVAKNLSAGKFYSVFDKLQ